MREVKEDREGLERSTEEQRINTSLSRTNCAGWKRTVSAEIRKEEKEDGAGTGIGRERGGMEKGKKEYLLETRIRREQRGRLWIIRSTTTILKPADCLYRETSLYRSRRLDYVSALRFTMIIFLGESL